ncbi:MAG: acetamidase/formamidase family protein [bacterium]
MKSKVVLAVFVAAAVALCSSGLAQAKEHVYRPTPDKFYFLFGGGEPVLKVEPGDRVRLWCEDAFQGKVRTKDDVFSKAVAPIWPAVNPQTGPIYVEGAEPGDTLVLKVVSIEPDGKQGCSVLIPGFGFLSQTRNTSMLHDPLPGIVWIYPINKAKGTVTFVSRLGPEKYQVEIPMHPFVGTIGTAPADGERMHSLTPYFHGGNMDCVETAPGTTIYLPISVPGAMWSTGDVHLAQGDGETCGVAVEASAWVTIDILPLIKGKKVATPRFENDTYIMSAGSARPIDDAIRIAYVDMVNWLVEDYGFDKWDAYQLMTQVCPVRVGNIVDTFYTTVVKFPKKYLPK